MHVPLHHTAERFESVRCEAVEVSIALSTSKQAHKQASEGQRTGALVWNVS